MIPAILPGAELEVECGHRVDPGDVAVLVASGRVIVHRVAAVFETEDRLVTRGDATSLPDLPASLSCVVGRVAGIREGSGLRPVPAAPQSLMRRALLAACLWPLPRWPAACRGLVRGLWAARRWCVAYPAAAGRKLRRRGAAPVQDEDEAEPAEPARE